jgi:single-strand DNA-binding protein
MYQKLIIVGYLGNDPETRYTPSGIQVSNFSVATKKTWKNANGEKQEKTTWFRCAAWKDLADIVGQYLHKGSQVLVEGTVDTNAFTKQDGTPGSSLEVNIDVLRFLDRASNSKEAVQEDDEKPLW